MTTPAPLHTIPRMRTGRSRAALPFLVTNGGADAPDGTSDALLLRRLRSGDTGALDELLERYWAPVFRYASRISDSRDGAADVAQEVFCRLWERRASWHADGSVRGLIFRLARNAAVSHHRRQRARERANRGFAELHLATAREAPAAERAELRTALQDAVAALPVRRREVFQLRMLDDLSYDEIAEVMGISRQTVANQLSRALATLRTRLRRLLDR